MECCIIDYICKLICITAMQPATTMENARLRDRRWKLDGKPRFFINLACSFRQERTLFLQLYEVDALDHIIHV